METFSDTEAQLRVAERAAAAPFTDYPPTPWWYPPVVGAWAAGMVAALLVIGDRLVLGLVAILVLVALETAFIGWYRRKRGVMPALGSAPREIRAEMLRYAAGLVVVVAVILGLGLFAPPVVAIAGAFVLVGGGVAVYERRYARAASVTRARLRG